MEHFFFGFLVLISACSGVIWTQSGVDYTCSAPPGVLWAVEKRCQSRAAAALALDLLVFFERRGLFVWCKAMSMVCIWYGHKVALTKYYLTTHARRHLVYYGRCSLEQQQQRRRLLCSHLMRGASRRRGGCQVRRLLGSKKIETDEQQI